MLPSSSDLNYFIEVAQTMNLSRAAERLGLSQPSLSLSIQRLERDVGAKLFVRTKRGVHLTQVGRELFANARSLLIQWEKVKAGALQADSSIKGTYCVGVHPSVAQYTLPHFLTGLLTEFPDLAIKLIHDHSRKVAERVIAMEADVGIVVNPVRHPDLVIHRLCDDEVAFWSASGKPNELNQLHSDKKVLICDPELLQTQALLKNQRAEYRKSNKNITSSNLELIRSLVASGAGIGILPGRVAAFAKELRRLPGTPIFKDQICLVFRLENRSNPFIQALKLRLEKSLKE